MDIILCVTGSIAAIESVKLARELRRRGATIKCFMSDGACNIIHPYAMEFATGNDVILELTGEIEHVKYADADIILVAPATANVISKFAYKIADNPINALLIAAWGYGTPIVMVPSMNLSMYQAIKSNIEKLIKEGVVFAQPKIEEGKAKFPHLDDIILTVLREASPGNLKGKKVLVSAGGTYEAIDPVRGVCNLSSGKMGLELAKEAFIQGADVTLIGANLSLRAPSCIRVVNVLSAAEMFDKVRELIGDFDVFISAAAVADFRPEYAESKISSSRERVLRLKVNPKIIDSVKTLNPDVYLVGFKAEYDVSEDELIELAREQMERSGADLVVANDLAVEGFGSDRIKPILVFDRVKKLPLMDKVELSKILIELISQKL
ncbi:MAG TPA: bifunctional phosphopantothenoylcysteine decarboxylase/phosphopantothenate--cysteine ligase CoaBC [Methanothermobacter sp.]|nr:pantothenate metabolism flavoprotein [Methanothermobacter sp. MT-2]HHW04645.1 bifunctional phosphopantothenoylcysteine decarboxylase/phosphopantothenate--cysteine ligase CoaBC [Methanothermobacter sp.]HOK72110.1 bifunctional phosphopantothenoylcysteine decarboxylase/phosphopantothenate--cysteine ligase CoaBC [Methanothermobacter sp.]HOL68423.1 bifunctional phosphopantothenoylcysteine decarboxylase/phosphopantothenate--cysteine ligase CoaBC [Methanothermobacter sp.]HPQ04181.1 bifunctional pho